MFRRSRPSAHPRRRAWRRRAVPGVVLLLSLALSVGALEGQAFAEPPPDDDVAAMVDVPATDPVDGTDQSLTGYARQYAIDAAQDDTDPPDGSTAIPAAGPDGTADITPEKLAAAEDGLIQVGGGVPVKIGAASDDTTQQPVGTWSVDVLSQTDTTAAGVNGLLMQVTTSDTTPAPARLQVDYTDFKNYFGAQWSDRLQLVRYPECFLTDPNDEACATPEPLDNSADLRADTTTTDADGNETTDLGATKVEATVDLSTPMDADTATGTTSADATAALDKGSVQSAVYHGSAAKAVSAAASSGAGGVLGVTDSGNGAGGSFRATPLSSAGSWAAGSSSGGFAYTYAVDTPPVSAGPTPSIAFSYNSQAVDGKTSTANPQTSWIGEGWSYDTGHIERSYRGCGQDQDGDDANNKGKKKKTGDLCWASQNAVMTLGGTTVELVRDDTSGEWHPRSDDGTKIEHKTGADNGDGGDTDDKGEYWIATTRDGTKYYFGLDKVGNGHADTDSVSTVPVFGNDPKEPCHADAFKDSSCTQAWSWQLDEVVDLHGNAMVITYQQEDNYYAKNKSTKTNVKYQRGSYPLTIEYGLNKDDLGAVPAAKVQFKTDERCLAASASKCDADNFTSGDPEKYRVWYDTPATLNCKSDTAKQCPTFPSFWTRKRLEKVVTWAHRDGTSTLYPIDEWTLNHAFESGWYQTSPGLWLSSVQHGAYDTDTTDPDDAPGQTLPAVVFDGTAYPNRVRTNSDDIELTYWHPRITGITDENGKKTVVDYNKGCTYAPATTDIADNTAACYPVHWSPDENLDNPPLAWFNKYTVGKVTEQDTVVTTTALASPDVVTTYEYGGGGYWAKTDAEFTKPSQRTHSEWRGYASVTTRVGDPDGSAATRSKTTTYYLRGSGTTLKDDTGATLSADDADENAGQSAETVTYVSSESAAAAHSRVITLPGTSTVTATRKRTGDSDLVAKRTYVKRVDDLTAYNGKWRGTRTTTAMDDDGLPKLSEVATVTLASPGDTTPTVGDRTCTLTTFDNRASTNLYGLPKRTLTTATDCDDVSSAATAAVVSDVTAGYNDAGDATSEKSLDGEGTGTITGSLTEYDVYGRANKVTDAGKNVTRTAYNPGSSPYVITGTTITNAKSQATITTIDPARGLTTLTTDPNGNKTRYEYDLLGRLVKGWQPGDADDLPSTTISYALGTKTPTRVITKSLKDNGSYTQSVTFYDGMGRTVQTQAPDATGLGRLVTSVRYNDHGAPVRTDNGYYVLGLPATTPYIPTSQQSIPNSTRATYDGLGRPLTSTTLHHNADFATATNTYSDTDASVTVVPPTGATATKTLGDALGRAVKAITYTNADRSTNTYTETTYDALGNRTQVKDKSGHLWTWTYDSRHRVRLSTDPDSGTSQTWYDDADHVTQTKDATGKILHYGYDPLGRKSTLTVGSDAFPTDEWTYDTATKGIGLPAKSIRHTTLGSTTGDIVSEATGYTEDGQLTGKTVTVPAVSGSTDNLSGSYHWSYTYTRTGKPLTTTLPATPGGMTTAEKVVTRYNTQDLPVSTSGWDWYTTGAVYNPYGQITRSTSGKNPYRVWTSALYDDSTGLLLHSYAATQTASGLVSQSAYAYDQAGNTSLVATGSTTSGTTTWDNQCFTYDARGQLVEAWTGATTKSCTDSAGTTWKATDTSATASGTVGGTPSTSTIATGTAAYGSLPYWQSYRYDDLGNRSTLTDHSTQRTSTGALNTALDGSTSYAYGDTGQPDTLTGWTQKTVTAADSGTKTVTETNSATFDDAGRTGTRTINGDTQSFVYDGEGLLKTVTGFGAGSGAITGPGGLCMDDAGGHTTDGNVIQIYTCNGTAGQKFTANGGKLTVLGKCATASGTTTGSTITLKTCVPDATTQSFTLRSDGTFYNTASKLCLNVASATVSADLTLAACTASADTQKFTLAASTSYLYDADGNRISKTTGGWTTLYLGETEVMGSQTSTATKAMRSYAQAGAPTVVRYTSSATSAHTLVAQVTNPQGTATVQIKLASGMAVQTRSYDAWGNLRGDLETSLTGWAGSRAYIGGADESSTGLIHLGARDYDPVTGRFTSLDPVMDFSDLLQLGGYAYADNSPVTKEDPNGQMWGWSQIKHAAWSATKTVAHVAYEYSGLADIVSCATNPTLGTCLMAAATIIITVATFGEGGVALAAARGGMRFGGGVLARGAEQAAVKTAEKTAVKTATKAVEKKVVKTAEEKAAKATEKSAAKASEKSAAKTGEKDAGKASDAGEDAVESGGKCNSFTPNTRVLLANGKTKAIKDLRPGDKVRSTDPILGTTASRTVTATIEGHGTKHLVRLTLANGKSITATDGHPIWLPKLHRWAKASELRSGDWLQTSAGTYVQVKAVRAWTQTATVNNLTVSGTHTYYALAGATAVLVHNCGDAESAATWVEEGGDLSKGRRGMPSNAYEYQSGTTGARSSVASRRALAPQLEMPAADGTVVTAKFDGVNGSEIIDRKLNPMFTEKSVDQARRQAATAAYHGLTAVYEVPDEAALAAMNRFMTFADVSTIVVRIGL
ncbi:ricin-type beta-trefoil lectin domain protein [Streptomyces xylophagus]|uniref:ricin-type beta-trefoil lectin domain protein n=1 Tax=Streptomyces xylophagus TaxID=285514 RepID=UPI00131D5FF6|nr:ricin-type beta-trefoil lectin domain protein [Streptomyces xylophagus]